MCSPTKSIENEYNELMAQLQSEHDALSLSSASPQKLIISRRDSRSRSRSNRREEMEEKMDEIMDHHSAMTVVHRHGGGGSGSSASSSDNEYKSAEIGRHEYTQLLVDCMRLLEGIVNDDHFESLPPAHTPNSPRTPQKNMSSKPDIHHHVDSIDVDSFRDLMESVRCKLKKQEIRQFQTPTPIKRDIRELRRFSQSVGGGHSQFLETLDNCIGTPSTADEADPEQVSEPVVITDIIIPLKADHDSISDVGAGSNDEVERYEADNEDLDANQNINDSAEIPQIDENQRKCVEQFLLRYSEEESWKLKKEETDSMGQCYELEIEFNENITLEDRKKNQIAIRADILHSVTELIENIMGIQYEEKKSKFTASMWYENALCRLLAVI